LSHRQAAVKETSRPSSNRFFSLGVPASVIILALLGFVAFANAIRHPFVHDDVVFIQQNPYIARWDNIGDSFLNPSIPRSFEGLVTPYYRPVLEVFYRLQYAVFGFNPHGFHLFNVIVHVLNGLLIFGILRRLMKDRWRAWFIAALFLIHPVQTQAVACISGISNLLCGFFILSSLMLYLRASACRDPRPKLGWFSGALILFTAALFTKEQAVFALALFVLYEIFLNDHRESAVTRIYRVVILGVAAAGYLSCRNLLFGSLTSAVFENIGELKLRLLAIPGLIEMFIGLLLYPVGLHYYRSIDILAPYIVPWLVLIVLAALTVVAVRRLPRGERDLACFGLAWFFILLLPVLNIVPLVNEYSFLAAWEHGLYLPLIGFFVFLFAVISPLLGKANPKMLGISGAVIIAVLSVMTMRQNTYWRGEIPLFERALAYEPQLGRVHVLLAKAYLFNGRTDDALREFDKARVIMSAYAAKAASPKARGFYEGFLKSIYADSAHCRLSKGNFNGAIADYNLALAIDPKDSFLYTNRGLSMIQIGQMYEGIADLETALRLDPGNVFAANNLSIAYIQSNRTDDARVLLEQILTKDPAFIPARQNLERLNRSPGSPGNQTWPQAK
jgi:protein O-mannosyl-transferase